MTTETWDPFNDHLRAQLLDMPCQRGTSICGEAPCCLDPVECWRLALDTPVKPCDTAYVEPGQPNKK